jgi:dienelactone hydrolase
VRVALVTRDLPYRDAGTELAGVLVCDDSAAGPRPGLLLVHGGAGLDDHAREQARRYAALGYTVLACDMYGAGVAGNRERIMATVTALRDDPDLLVRRAGAGLDALAGCPEAGGSFGAVGFCFGGMTVLTLARAGARVAGQPLGGVVSMHGSLATKRPAQPGEITARVLACHGAADPHVPMVDVTAFAAEMAAAGADWQLNVYGGAQHGFTHRHAVPGAMPGVEYHEATDERSFAAATEFLASALVAS